jgi:hypothetical protein
MVSTGWCHCAHSQDLHQYREAAFRQSSHINERAPHLACKISRFIGMSFFFLWGYLKSLVYADRQQNIETLKANIHRAISNIPEDMLSTCMQGIRRRCKECLRKNGGHINDIIFRK